MNLVLLNGVHGTAQQMAPLAQALGPAASVVTLDLLGHAGREVPPVLSAAAMAADVLAQMDERNIASAHLCGYSFGGYVALYLARHAPKRVLSITTIATKTVFDRRYNSLVTFLLSRHLDPAENKPPQVERRLELERLHGPRWKDLCQRNLDLCLALAATPELSPADLRQITQPSLCIGFQQDKLVLREETIQLSRALPNTQTIILAGAGHPFSGVPAHVIAAEMRTRLLS